MFPIFWNNWTDPLISILKTNCCWNMIGTTRGTKFSIIQVIVFPFLVNRGVSPFSIHMNIRVLSMAYEAIELQAVSSSIALLRTDRDHEQKNLCFLVYLHISSRGQYRSRVFGPSQSIPSDLSSKPPCSACALKLPNPQQTYDLLCFWRLFLHRRIKRSFIFSFKLVYFSSQIPRCFAGTSFLSGGFLKCSFLKTGRARISLVRFIFLDNASRFPPEF